MGKIKISDINDYKNNTISLEKRKYLLEQKNEIFINNFVTTLEKDQDIDLNLFYNNLERLTINKEISGKFKFSVKIAELLTGGSIKGLYSIEHNEMNYKMDSINKQVDTQINHELFHVASSYYDNINKISFSGFLQKNRNKFFIIGNTLNEGYTELLNNRYFPTKSLFNLAYTTEQKIAKIIEEIIGESKIKKAYFRADLNILIQELINFETEENIIKFLKYDITYTLNDKNNLSTINNFLFKIYFKKLYLQFKDKEITEEQIIFKLAMYFHYFGANYFNDNFKEILGKELSSNILENYKKIVTEENEEISNSIIKSLKF